MNRQKYFISTMITSEPIVQYNYIDILFHPGSLYMHTANSTVDMRMTVLATVSEAEAEGV